MELIEGVVGTTVEATGSVASDIIVKVTEPDTGTFALVGLFLVWLWRFFKKWSEANGKLSAEREKIEAYRPYALMAVNAIEKIEVPGEVGTGVKKSLYKSVEYAKQFTAIIRQVEGKDPSKELLDAAMKWSAEYVSKLSEKKESK